MSESQDPEESSALVPAGERSLAAFGGGLASRALALAGELLARLPEALPPGEVRCFRGHSDCVVGVAFSPEGRHAFSASWDGTWRTWELESGRELRRCGAHGHRVSCIACSADGARIATGGWDGTVRMWDRDSGEETARFGEPGSGLVYCVALSPDGRTLAWGGSAIALCDLVTGAEFRRCEVPVSPVRALRFSRDGRLLLSGSGQVALTSTGRDNGAVCLWNPATGDRLWGWADAREPALCVDFSADGSTVFAATGWPARGHLNTTRTWEVESGREVSRHEAHRHPIFAGTLLPGGRYLLATRDRLLRLWDPGTEAELHRFTGHTDAVYALALSPDGRHALTGSADCTLRLWRLPA